jgi:hypothetical protein
MLHTLVAQLYWEFITEQFVFNWTRPLLLLWDLRFVTAYELNIAITRTSGYQTLFYFENRSYPFLTSSFTYHNFP